MNLGDLLFEQKYGASALEEFREKKTINDAANLLQESLDEDFGTIITSSFLNEEIKKMPDSNSDIIEAFNRVSEIFSNIEKKKETRGFIPNVYGRMQLDALKENYEIIQEELENPKTLKIFKKEDLAKTLAFVKFSSYLIAEESFNSSFFLENFDNSTLNEAVIKQEDVLKTVFKN